ncbi:MAG: restriction endonuclease subunit S [Alphaproteobacteria bacterium]
MKKEFESNGGKWEKYTLEHAQLFQIKGSKSLDEGKLTFTEKGINFVGRVDDNNGIKGKISLQDFNPNEKNTITATVIGNYKYAKFQESEYYCSQNINVLKPNFEINRFIALYLVTHIQKFISKYNGQQSGYKLNELAKHEIILPTLNKSLAFDYMEHYICELEQACVSELATYLRAAGLEDYDLTAAEQTALDDFKNGKIRFKEFKITGENGIFSVKNTHSILKNQIVPNSGNYPYVTAGETNNSILTYISYDKSFLEKGNSIMIAGKSMVITYQEKNYFSNDSHNLSLSLKIEINKTYKHFLFLVSALYKSLHDKYSWGDSISKEKIKKDLLWLPVIDDKSIDYHFMESFITAQQKLAIKDVVLWKNKIISTTKKSLMKAKISLSVG